jgi:hypothetical protein
MSVLNEALSMVVRKSELEARYPGGAEGFYAAVLALENPPRFVVTLDPYLVSLSFYDGGHANPAFLLLAAWGFEECRAGAAADLALVDQRLGPTLPCAWLRWRRHSDGFTYAWSAGCEPGDMAVPEAWTAEQSRALVFTDIREEPGRALPLGRDADGTESWLDLRKGRNHAGRAEAQAEGPLPSAGVSPADCGPAAAGHLEEVCRGLDELGCPYRRSGRGVHFRVRGRAAGYAARFLVDAHRPPGDLRGFGGTLVPEGRRAAVAEALSRINWRLRLGCFEMDWSDGELHFRTSVDVAGGCLAPAMVGSLLFAGMSAQDRYHAARMRVVYAGADPPSTL